MTTKKTQPTLKASAIQFENREINSSEMEQVVRDILRGPGFTETHFDAENPNKMVFKGSPENSLLTLDRLDAERTIERETWRAIRGFIEKHQKKIVDTDG